jgi:hypothetical protein
MENKYYTPELEEFCEGFEYEVNNTPGLSDEWTPVKISGLNWFPSEFQIVSLKIRVKYLDKEDIERLGWNSIPVDRSRLKRLDSLCFELKDKLLIFFNNTVKIITSDWQKCYFEGVLKNKSELKKLMKQLRINGE